MRSVFVLCYNSLHGIVCLLITKKHPHEVLDSQYAAVMQILLWKLCMAKLEYVYLSSLLGPLHSFVVNMCDKILP
jgi:hypothetical protein